MKTQNVLDIPVHPTKRSLVCVSLQVFVAMAWEIHPELQVHMED
jgi:hypothetical protein